MESLQGIHPPEAIPSPAAFLTALTAMEPNSPDADPGLSLLLEELGDAWLAFASAFSSAAGLLMLHQPDLAPQAAAFEAAARGLSDAGHLCQNLAPDLRGLLPVMPWAAPLSVPPRIAHKGDHDHVARAAAPDVDDSSESPDEAEEAVGGQPQDKVNRADDDDDRGDGGARGTDDDPRGDQHAGD